MIGHKGDEHDEEGSPDGDGEMTLTIMQYVRGKEGFEFAEDIDMEVNTEIVV